MKILCCSVGTEKRQGGYYIGLQFLAELIKRKRPQYDLHWIRSTDLANLTAASADLLLISLVSVLAVPALWKSLRGKRPPLRTIIGGPGANAAGLLRHLADAVIVGRGEDAIFEAIDGNYAGFALPGPTMANNSVKVWPATLLSPDKAACGCGIKCSFCSYGWGNHYAVCNHADQNRYAVSVKVPSQEQLIQHVTVADIRAHFSFFENRIVAGLDGICPNDLYIVRKPLSWGRLEGWIRQIGAGFRPGEKILRNLRIYLILNYPWHCRLGYPPEEMVELQQLCVETRSAFPKGVRIVFDLGVQCFVPTLFTPMEREPLMLQDCRERLYNHNAPNAAKTRGIALQVHPERTPSLKTALQETLMLRTEDLSVLDAISNAKTWQELAEKYEPLLQRQEHRPQPWIERPNDSKYREFAYYRDLDRLYPGLVPASFNRGLEPAKKAAKAQPLRVPMMVAFEESNPNKTTQLELWS